MCPLVELGQLKIRAFTNLARGITVSTASSPAARAPMSWLPKRTPRSIFRIQRLGDYAVLQRKFATLRPRDKRCRLEVTGDLNRPPMERTREIAALFKTAQRLAAELGVKLEESATGGGSDGNFTAALGVPTLDGLGAVGEGAHALHESILVDRIADRTALLAQLVPAI